MESEKNEEQDIENKAEKKIIQMIKLNLAHKGYNKIEGEYNFFDNIFEAKIIS